MAKWGEGDPRWIVEERPDATNVNNWHWSEKNATTWSQEKLKDLLQGLVIEVPALGRITLEEVTQCNGEATVNNRKGKLIFFYEWNLTVSWTAKTISGSDVKGNLEIPNLSEENEPDEVDVNVTVTSGGESGYPFKEYLLKKGVKRIREKVAEYIQCLRVEYSSDLILPTKGQAAAEVKRVQSAPPKTQSRLMDKAVHSATGSFQKMGIDGKVETCDIKLTESFKCTADELYNVFIIPEMMIAFTRGPVKITGGEGGIFELFGGNITGQFKKLVPNKQIVQSWRYKSWQDGHHSMVTLDFIQKADCTELQLTQTSVPLNDVEQTRLGWQNYYWESIKRTFGFGALLT